MPLHWCGGIVCAFRLVEPGRYLLDLDWQFAHVAGIDRYAIAIRIDQLEVVVTKQLVLSDCIHSQSLFH